MTDMKIFIKTTKKMLFGNGNKHKLLKISGDYNSFNFYQKKLMIKLDKYTNIYKTLRQGKITHKI